MQTKGKTHGHRRGNVSSPTYQSWNSMWDRCRRSHHPSHRHYEGVSVCDRWRSFENFLADMGERPVGKTLDRIDGTKGYNPGNCKWSTLTEQARNKSNNRLITHQGRTQCLAAWAETTGIDYYRLRDRINRGWPLEKALGVKHGV